MTYDVKDVTVQKFAKDKYELISVDLGIKRQNGLEQFDYFKDWLRA